MRGHKMLIVTETGTRMQFDSNGLDGRSWWSKNSWKAWRRALHACACVMAGVKNRQWSSTSQALGGRSVYVGPLCIILVFFLFFSYKINTEGTFYRTSRPSVCCEWDWAREPFLNAATRLPRLPNAFYAAPVGLMHPRYWRAAFFSSFYKDLRLARDKGLGGGDEGWGRR